MITYLSIHGVFEEQTTDIYNLVPFPVADTMVIEPGDSDTENSTTNLWFARSGNLGVALHQAGSILSAGVGLARQVLTASQQN